MLENFSEEAKEKLRRSIKSHALDLIAESSIGMDSELNLIRCSENTLCGDHECEYCYRSDLIEAMSRLKNSSSEKYEKTKLFLENNILTLLGESCLTLKADSDMISLCDNTDCDDCLFYNERGVMCREKRTAAVKELFKNNSSLLGIF